MAVRGPTPHSQDKCLTTGWPCLFVSTQSPGTKTVERLLLQILGKLTPCSPLSRRCVGKTARVLCPFIDQPTFCSNHFIVGYCITTVVKPQGHDIKGGGEHFCNIPLHSSKIFSRLFIKGFETRQRWPTR